MRVAAIAMLFAGGLGLVLAGQDQCCSQQDRKNVIREWTSAFNSGASGKSKVAVATQVFVEFFKLAPEAVEILKRVHSDNVESPEFHAHALRVISGLDRAINNLMNPKALHADLHHLAVQHSHRPGVTQSQFEAITKVLETALPQVLSEYHSDSWRKCLEMIIEGISNAVP